MLTKTFTGPNDFDAVYEAETWLKSRGFAYGSMQRDSPRGIMFGDFDISKWRNLNKADIKALHGVMRGDMRHGPVIVELFETAPVTAQDAFGEVERV